jgi:NAD(P)-dependent dehydrogenase (short-subunit alcohol dehydrogenase family)
MINFARLVQFPAQVMLTPIDKFKNAGIRVNSITPGYFSSEVTIKESEENQKSRVPQEKIDNYRHIPMGRSWKWYVFLEPSLASFGGMPSVS